MNFSDASPMWGWRAGNVWDSGCTGRLGVMEGNFMRMGGYDESFEATGYQDIDVFERFKACGRGQAFFLKDFPHGCSIPNSTDLKEAKAGVKIQFTASTLQWHAQNGKKQTGFET